MKGVSTQGQKCFCNLKHYLVRKSQKTFFSIYVRFTFKSKNADRWGLKLRAWIDDSWNRFLNEAENFKKHKIEWTGRIRCLKHPCNEKFHDQTMVDKFDNITPNCLTTWDTNVIKNET